MIVKVHIPLVFQNQLIYVLENGVLILDYLVVKNQRFSPYFDKAPKHSPLELDFVV